jgi:hypothetical protein
VKRFVAALLMLSGLLVAGGANAVATITFSVVGNDVQATITGTLITTGLTPASTATEYGLLQGNAAAVVVGTTTPTTVNSFNGAVGPTNFGTGSSTLNANSGTGGPFGIFGFAGSVFLPTTFVSGGSVSATSTWTNTSIAGLGLTPGTYTYTWSGDSLIVVIPSPAPPPASIPSLSEWTQLLLALMVITVVGWHFRREQNIS